jgi:GDP-6-deoxy-D-talose 4-dehydrogenase
VDFRSDRVVVTGGTGFTGRGLVQKLRDSGHDVIALGHRASAAGVTNVDLCELGALAELLGQTRPSVVIHLAGIAAPFIGRVDEIYAVNVIGTANLFAALLSKKVEPRLVIVASSAHVYALKTLDRQLTEESHILPGNHYGASKRAVEDIARIHSRDFHIIVTRPFNYTGPGQSSDFIIPKLVQHFAERRREIRVGNLDIFRDISDVRRVIEAYVRLVDRPIEPLTINICSGRAIHLASVLRTLQKISGRNIEVVTDSAFLRQDEPKWIIGSPARLEAVVGRLPNPDFRETLEQMYDAAERRLGAGR